MKNSFNANKIIYTIFLVVALVLIVPAINYVGVALGWVGPLLAPPNGSGAVSVNASGMVGIGLAGPTASTSLTIGGDISFSGTSDRIRNLSAPIDGNDAVNKDYVSTAGGSTTGAGSVVLYYRTLNGVPQPQGTPAPTCASIGTGWTFSRAGYGPHYIGVVSYDWLYNGTGGSGGGFGGTGVYNSGGGGTQGPPPDPPPPPGGGIGGGNLALGYNYNVNAIAFGSDSVCSTSQVSVIPVGQFYQNTLNTGTTNGATFYADACSTTTNLNSPPPTNTECNMCIVCVKP